VEFYGKDHHYMGNDGVVFTSDFIVVAEGMKAMASGSQELSEQI
jgi:hypothetical protein